MQKPEIAGRECPPARLRTRAEFVRTGKGRRLRTPCFSLQMLARPAAADPQPPRFGFTVTKKLGDAVLRNRIRRRLKEALRPGQRFPGPGHDYVILAQPAALTEDFAALQLQISQAIADIHAAPRKRRYAAIDEGLVSAPCRRNNRNLVLAMALSILVIIGWNYFFGAPQYQKEHSAQLAQQQGQPAATGAGLAQLLAAALTQRPTAGRPGE